jgi:hypothetical protein
MSVTVGAAVVPDTVGVVVGVVVDGAAVGAGPLGAVGVPVPAVGIDVVVVVLTAAEGSRVELHPLTTAPAARSSPMDAPRAQARRYVMVPPSLAANRSTPSGAVSTFPLCGREDYAASIVSLR